MDARTWLNQKADMEYDADETNLDTRIRWFNFAHRATGERALIALLEKFAAHSHSWIKITDDPQTLPPPLPESEVFSGRLSDEVLTTDWHYSEVSRFVRWESPKTAIDGGIGYWTNQRIIPTHWREIGELPAPPPES